MVSPCVDVLRKLARRINGSLGSHQGAKHSAPDLSLDIERLMSSLKSHEVYVQKAGRVLHVNEKPAADILSSGLAMLTHGTSSTPLDEFNDYYKDLRRRWALSSVSELLEKHTTSTRARDEAGITEEASQRGRVGASPADLWETTEQDSVEEDVASSTGSEQSNEDILDSPTLECLNEEDVDLDMDVVELDADGELD